MWRVVCVVRFFLLLIRGWVPHNDHFRDHLARALRTGIAFARMSGLEHIMAHLKMKVRSQTTHGLAYNQQRESTKRCMSGHTAAVKLHNQGKS